MALSRRGFIAGLFAAPAIVHIDNLMPIKAIRAGKFYIETSIVAPYKAFQAFESGCYYCPYVPLRLDGTVYHEHDIASVPVRHVSFRTRYST